MPFRLYEVLPEVENEPELADGLRGRGLLLLRIDGTYCRYRCQGSLQQGTALS